jgi:hypothetical protein
VELSDELSEEVSDELSTPGVSAAEAEPFEAVVSGEVWSPDWMLSVSGPAMLSIDFVAAGFTGCLTPLLCVPWVADAMAEPPSARAVRAAAAPVIVFSRLRMIDAPSFWGSWAGPKLGTGA